MSNTTGIVGGTPFTDSSSAGGSSSGAAGVVESDRKFAALRAKKAAARARAEHAEKPATKKQR